MVDRRSARRSMAEPKRPSRTAKLGNFAKMSARVSVRELYADLHAKIVQGRFRPGEALSELRLADLYGVSRTPIREVFWRLGEDGFLRVVPQVGTFVAPINIAAVEDCQFVRETLECKAMGIAARKASAADIVSLRQQLALQDEAISRSDRFAFFTSDEAFHRLLMTMAGHPFVWPVIASAKAQLDRVRYLSLENADWLRMIFAQHREIVEHMAAHDAKAAQRAMQQHLRTIVGAISRIADEHADFFEEPVGKTIGIATAKQAGTRKAKS